MKHNNTLEMGKLLAQKEYSRISKRGKNWKQRNIPSYIRENLMTPYYLTVTEQGVQMYIIQYPSSAEEKVHFIRHELHDEKITKVFTST